MPLFERMRNTSKVIDVLDFRRSKSLLREVPGEAIEDDSSSKTRLVDHFNKTVQVKIGSISRSVLGIHGCLDRGACCDDVVHSLQHDRRQLCTHDADHGIHRYS